MQSRRHGDAQRLNVAAADKSRGSFGGLCGEDAASEMPPAAHVVSGGLRTLLHARPGLGRRLRGTSAMAAIASESTAPLPPITPLLACNGI